MRIFPENNLPLGEVARVVLAAGGREPAKDVDKEQLAIGMAVELEHTDDPAVAERITRQHLAEEPDYYTKPMKKDWGADEAKERIEDMAKNAQIEINDNPWEWNSRTNRDMSCQTLAGIVNMIDFQLGRPVEPPEESRIRNKALEHANIAVEKSPHRDHGDGSQKMRIAIVDAITKAYYDEMNVRRNWGFKPQLTGTPSWETTKTAQVDISINKGWLYKCKRCGKQHLGVLVQPQQCGIEGCDSPDFDKLPYESKEASSISHSSAGRIKAYEDLVQLDGNVCSCPSCGGKSRVTPSALSAPGMSHRKCPHCKENFFVSFNSVIESPNREEPISLVAQKTNSNKNSVAIVDHLMQHNTTTNHELITQFGVSEIQADAIIRSLLPTAFGPSGKGYDWFVKQVDRVLNKSTGDAVVHASVFILEDDPDRIAIFKSAFGSENIIATCNVKVALDLLRSRKFARVFLDRDLSSLNENGEDVAWQMEREKLASSTPVVIHSENTRGQKVMARYLRKYHSNVSVVPFRELRKSLEVPGGIKL